MVAIEVKCQWFINEDVRQYEQKREFSISAFQGAFLLSHAAFMVINKYSDCSGFELKVIWTLFPSKWQVLVEFFSRNLDVHLTFSEVPKNAPTKHRSFGFRGSNGLPYKRSCRPDIFENVCVVHCSKISQLALGLMLKKVSEKKPGVTGRESPEDPKAAGATVLQLYSHLRSYTSHNCSAKKLKRTEMHVSNRWDKSEQYTPFKRN